MLEMLGACLVFVFLALFLAIKLKKTNGGQGSSLSRAQLEQLEVELKDSAYYSYTSDTLFLKKRDPRLRDLIKIRNAINYDISYTPGKYVYTSVSSGGITVGGVDKIEGHMNYDEVKTKKFELIFGNHYSGNIRTICLGDNLLAEAKTSKIQKYINGNNIVVYRLVDPSKLQAMYGTYSLAVQYALISDYPDLQHCEEILDWICGVD